MLTFYRALLAFRRGHAVWGTGDMRLVELDDPAILAFVRANDEEAYLVLESFSEDDEEGGAATPDVPAAGTVVWGDAHVDVSAGSVHVKVPGKGSAVVKLR